MACYGGTDVMERSCAVARGKDINSLGPLRLADPPFPSSTPGGLSSAEAKALHCKGGTCRLPFPLPAL
jgi:hypothetical protein